MSDKQVLIKELAHFLELADALYESHSQLLEFLKEDEDISEILDEAKERLFSFEDFDIRGLQNEMDDHLFKK